MKRIRREVPSKSDPGGEEFHKKALDARTKAKQEKELMTKLTMYLKMQLTDKNIEAFTKKIFELGVADPNSRCGQFMMNVLFNEETILDRLHALTVIENAEKDETEDIDKGW